jgi:sphinganine-1-phosphate aldolase
VSLTRACIRPTLKLSLVPLSAHAAFWKGADYYGLRLREIPLRDTHADYHAMEAAINGNTCCVRVQFYVRVHSCLQLVGSAPNFPYGTIDPLDEISRVGACVLVPD